MNGKNELYRRYQEKHGCSFVAAKNAIDEVFENLSDMIRTLEVGEDLTFSKFGRFKKTVRPERVARNPRTGETVAVPEKEVIKFKLSSTMNG